MKLTEKQRNFIDPNHMIHETTYEGYVKEIMKMDDYIREELGDEYAIEEWITYGVPDYVDNQREACEEILPDKDDWFNDSHYDCIGDLVSLYNNLIENSEEDWWD